jgi:hypothetical protein
MGFFTLAAALVQPIDQFIAFHVPIGHNPEDLVTDVHRYFFITA